MELGEAVMAREQFGADNDYARINREEKNAVGKTDVRRSFASSFGGVVDDGVNDASS